MQILHSGAVNQIRLVWRGADWAEEAAEAYRSSSGQAITRRRDKIQDRTSSVKLALDHACFNLARLGNSRGKSASLLTVYAGIQPR